MLEKFKKTTLANGWFEENRKRQSLKWFHERIIAQLETNFFSQSGIKEKIQKREELISSQKISVRKAVDELFS